MFRQLVLSRPAATLATIVVFVLTCSLGVWQLDRMQQKLDLAADLAAKEVAAPLNANARNWSLADAEHHRMLAKGKYLADKTIWLDNRPNPAGADPKTGTVAGFYVLTPLLLEHSGQLLWVNRGWAPRDAQDRERLPVLNTPQETIEVEGLVFEHAARVMNLGQNSSVANVSQIRQNLNLQEESKKLDLPFLPFVLRQSKGGINDSLDRRWAPIATGAEKHQGYAFQWFALAGLALSFWLLSGLFKKK
jgi:surfeit locus 1 family protein